MPKRRGGEEEGVSLFPFLSIIACVIGVLTLLISALALAQMGGNEDIAKIEQLQKLQRDLKALQEEIERLRGELDEDAIRKANEMDEKRRQLLAAQQRLKELEELIAQLREKGAKPKEVVDIPEVEGEIPQQALDDMQTELRGLREQIAQLEKSLAERKKKPEESEVSVVPGGSGIGFEPIFVECTAQSIVIHTGHGQDEPVHVPVGGVEGNKAFLDLLDHVAASNKRTLVFLLRDNGLGTYRKVRDLADWAEVRNGKLPVIGKGRLDLSYFNKKDG
jgi:hypothetical protein